ncbi:MAG: hypothetical protein HS116_11825 [Planctomycetes bacterium]|nr:hypothetical protein [Planctomycetota bacterium]
MAVLRSASAPAAWKWLTLGGIAAGLHAVGFFWILGQGQDLSKPGQNAQGLDVVLSLGAQEAEFLPGSAEFRGELPDPVPVRPSENWQPESAQTLPEITPQPPLAQPRAESPPAGVPEVALNLEGMNHKGVPEGAGRTGGGSAASDPPLTVGPLAEATRPTGAPAATGANSKSNKGLGSAPAPGSSAQPPELRLPGQPAYPRECRGGLCRHGAPCQGTGTWRLTAAQSGLQPSEVEQVTSTGCARLDASAARFLKAAQIPQAGRFTVRIRFQLEP